MRTAGLRRMFDICLSTEIVQDVDDGVSNAVYGSIAIGEFRETFIASLSTWSPTLYERQWQEAAQRLVNGESKSAFITFFVSPGAGNSFMWWPCYLSGEVIHVQNQLRFYDRLPRSFTIDALYDFVEDRKLVSDDGVTKLSEWQMPIEWMREFLRKHNRI